MAAVDALLRLILVRNAEVLVITSGQVPVLRKAGDAQPLSMPPLAAELVASLVDEVLDDDARGRLGDAGAAETTYALPDGSRFALLIESRDGGYRMA
ncbi:MAG: hypothetical protein KC464_08980, partial [Myxococcales bacterium]|nr:hypothetical protein [Myxococcales bacterium]